MDKGRKICDVLKAVRKKIADMNGKSATTKDIAAAPVLRARQSGNT